MKKIFSIVTLCLCCLLLTGFASYEEILVDKDVVKIGSSFHENYLQYQNLNQNIGFLNTEGEIAIEAKYTMASNFSEGLAAVIQDGELCYINTNGDTVLKTLLAPSDFVFDDPWYNKEEHFPIRWFDFSCDRALKFDSVSKKWGFMNKRGEAVIPCEYDHVEQFQDGLAVVKKDGKFGVIDKNNRYIIELGKYQMVKNIGAGYIVASNQLDELNLMEAFSLIDDTGKMIKARIEGHIDANVSEGCFAVDQDERLTIYDTTGSERFSLPVFEDEPFRMLRGVEPSSEGIMLVEYWYENSGEDKYGYIDSGTGKMLIEPQYDNAFSFSDGVAVVEKNGNYGVIDHNNTVLIPFQYDEWGYINSFIPVSSFDGTIPLYNGRRVLVKHQTEKQQYTVEATSVCLEINDSEFSLAAYNIGGNNYFKLRDLAIIFADSDNKFAVQWDEKQKAIFLQSEISQKGTIPSVGKTEKQVAVQNKATVYYDGKLIELEAYNISGNTYFKLRDIGNLLGFSTTWDAKENKIVI